MKKQAALYFVLALIMYPFIDTTHTLNKLDSYLIFIVVCLQLGGSGMLLFDHFPRLRQKPISGLICGGFCILLFLVKQGIFEILSNENKCSQQLITYILIANGLFVVFGIGYLLIRQIQLSKTRDRHA